MDYGNGEMNKAGVFLSLLFLPVSAGAMSPISDADLSDVSSPASLSILSDQAAGSGDARGGRDIVIDVQELGSAGDTDPDDTAWNRTDGAHDTTRIQEAQTKSSHSMEYPDGKTTSRDDAIITDLRPDGRTQLRIYYTKDSSSTIMPKSWVDIKTR